VAEADLRGLPGWCYWPGGGFQLGDLGPGGGDELGVGVRAAAQAPAALGGLGQQHPGAVDQGWGAGRLGDDAGELAYCRELLVPVRHAYQPGIEPEVRLFVDDA
jgi:hypothetical protein